MPYAYVCERASQGEKQNLAGAVCSPLCLLESGPNAKLVDGLVDHKTLDRPHRRTQCPVQRATPQTAPEALNMRFCLRYPTKDSATGVVRQVESAPRPSLFRVVRQFVWNHLESVGNKNSQRGCFFGKCCLQSYFLVFSCLAAHPVKADIALPMRKAL